ncbi:hypothetical protein CHRY9390_03199 [Chryseobacterium aquaeductus]|uniref:Uncharacterized protein n=1 Tax=Chryseobacterium aquaeductus TaxID=2675056 RepID=A0A9N8MIN4_9FLAO|nr:hypothetical protein [Chryseobacterium aquaeductus]CAA7332476.1 hypothetical protein CHRY9390_03199 [Chryseobacterium potabilaquae]CAD7816587.1 hypothetical protein CHRY9390_03199 [Chryseobacterium aquaeductus]
MNRKLLIILIYFYALVFSVLKSIRLPNEWSEAHWMLDYRLGFIKRGLAGEIFGFFFEKNEFSILVLTAVILAGLYVVVLFTAIKYTNVSKERFNYDVLFYTIFFLSQYVVFTADLIAYFDHLIFLMTFLSVYFIKKKLIFLSSILISVALLIHELSFFLMLPISLFTLVVIEFKDQNHNFKNLFESQFIKKIGLFLFLPFVTIFSISYYQEIGGSQYAEILNYLQSINFISDVTADSVANAYTSKFTYYLKEESGRFFQRLFISRCTILYGIPLFLMMILIFKKFIKVNFYILILLIICTLIPLLLHAIAWDTYRIWSFPYMILFLGNWILNSEFKQQISTEKIPFWILPFFVISFLLVSMIPNPLLHIEEERFSWQQRLLLLIPFSCLIVFYLKSPKKNFEA